MDNNPVMKTDSLGDVACCQTALDVLQTGDKLVEGIIQGGGGVANPLTDGAAAVVEASTLVGSVVGLLIDLGGDIFGHSGPAMGPPQPSVPSAPSGTTHPGTPSAPTATTHPGVPSAPTGTVPAKAPQAVKEATGLPTPGKGKGSVPPDQRDPKRVWTKQERQAQLDKQEGRCAQCGEPKTIDETNGHHKVRHADGGTTTSDNHAEVCHDCHVKLHQ
jgi:hypothetical protein